MFKRKLDFLLGAEIKIVQKSAFFSNCSPIFWGNFTLGKSISLQNFYVHFGGNLPNFLACNFVGSSEVKIKRLISNGE